MAIVEYLLIVQKAESFCDSVEAFNRLLRVDSSIVIDGGKITHRGDFECGYRITSGEIQGKDQRFFHLRFSSDGKSQEDFDRFTEFLRTIRIIVDRIDTQPETLWDDISLYYARQGYDLIHRIENLMRKLIANFMLVTIGKEWVSEASPSEVKKAIDSSPRRGYFNVLHTIDFSHLSDFLLKPYSEKQPSDIVAQLKSATTLPEFEAIKLLVPESNWKRYFSQIVSCDDGYLKKRWDELYQLRCKVAHNALIVKADLDRITLLVEELESKLREAIEKLPQVKVPEDEVEKVAENAAIALSTLMGEFVSAWRELEGLCEEIALRWETNKIRPWPLHALFQWLRQVGLLDAGRAEQLDRLRNFKNHVIHPTGVVVSEADLRGATKQVVDLMVELRIKDMDKRMQEMVDRENAELEKPAKRPRKQSGKATQATPPRPLAK